MPDVQAPQPRRTIPNSQPLESQSDHQRDRPITGQTPQHHQPRGQRGYRAEQAVGKASERAKHSRNAWRVDATVWSDVAFYLALQWSPEQIADKVGVSHECVYLHVYANKAAGGDLYKNLRSQKPRRKRHLCGRDRRGQIPNRRSISERPSHIEDRKQVGHWEGDTVIGAAHKQAIVTLVERRRRRLR